MASSNFPAAIISLARWDCKARSSDCHALDGATKKKRTDSSAVRPVDPIRAPLPGRAQAEADLPLSARAGDLHESARGYAGAADGVSSRACDEVRSVRQVEELRAELEFKPLLDRELARDVQVGVPNTRS